MPPPVLIIAPDVAAAIGANTTAQLLAGTGTPNAAQCWKCGGAVRIRGADPSSVALSVLTFQPAESDGLITITLWSHPEHSASRIVSYPEFLASPAANIASPVEPEMERIFIDDGS